MRTYRLPPTSALPADLIHVGVTGECKSGFHAWRFCCFLSIDRRVLLSASLAQARINELLDLSAYPAKTNVFLFEPQAVTDAVVAQGVE